MARRTKKDMEYMKDDCRYYLLQTKLDPHAAHELMIKEHLESGKMIPYYIKGVKDFITVSQELSVELNRKELMKKKDQEKQNEKETIINYIMGMPLEQIKVIYKEYKDDVSQTEKLVLHDVYMMIFTGELKERYIEQKHINLFTDIYNTQTQPA